MEIDIWNNQQVQEHLNEKNYPTWHHACGQDYVVGFNYVTPNFIKSRLEAQDNYDNSLADRSVVCLEDKNLIGIFAFMHFGKPASCFFPRFLEVRDDRLHRGVATALVKRLNDPCFLWGNVLSLNNSYYTEDGMKYLKKVMDRELFKGHFKIDSGADDDI
jgi:hypothetical protein